MDQRRSGRWQLFSTFRPGGSPSLGPGCLLEIHANQSRGAPARPAATRRTSHAPETRRLAGRRIGDAGAFNHYHFNAALVQEIGDRRTDHATTIDYDLHCAMASSLI